MLRYILTYGTEICIPNRPPINWDKLKYVFYRNLQYVGLFRKFNVKLEFVGTAKIFLENIVNTYGYNEEVTVTIQRYNSDTFTYETFLYGVINFGNISIKEYSIETNFENSTFEQTLLNRKGVEVAYQNDLTVDGEPVVKEVFEFIEVLVNYDDSTSANVQCIYPHEAIDRLIHLITGCKNRLRSSFFGRTTLGYGELGEVALYMLTKGLYFRDFATTTSNLNFSLESLLENGLFKIFNLGMAIEVENNIPYVRLEKREYFFKQDIVLTKTNVSDLQRVLDNKNFFVKINAGYNKSKKPDENTEGLAEYNAKSTYSIGHKAFKGDLNILSAIRADGATMKVLIDTVAEDEKQIDGDNDLFIIDCFVNAGNLQSREIENFYNYGGVYGANPYYVNLSITPARIIKNWGNHITTGLQFLLDKELQIQVIEGQSKVYTRLYSESANVTDGENIAINTLGNPILSPYLIKFKAPLWPDEIILLENNTDKLVKVWNNYGNAYLYGWINEVSTDPIDKVTTWELAEAFRVEPSIDDPCLLDTNDEPIYNQLGGKIILANNGNI